MTKEGNLLLDVLWVDVCNSKVSRQLRKTQRVKDAGSIRVVLQVVLGIVRQVVDFDIAAHLQQLVQGLDRLTGFHDVFLS